jgi:multiple sugar transport system substrate-binding protein
MRTNRRQFLRTLAGASLTLAAARSWAIEGTAETQRWLRDAASPLRGSQIHFISEATPPSVVLDQIKQEFTQSSGIEVEISIMPLDQVLTKSKQDAQGQLGAYYIYYLDQSWVANFADSTQEPHALYLARPDLAMPDFDWDDFAKPLMEGLATYQGKLVGIPFDIPIFISMYRPDVLAKLGLQAPTTMDEFESVTKAITKAGSIFGTALQARPGAYSLTCDWTQYLWNEGGSVFAADGSFSGHDEAGIRALTRYQEILANAVPQSITSNWDGQFQLMAAGRCAAVNTWAEHFPALDAADSTSQGLWMPARPLTSEPLRPRAATGYGEIPGNGHQGGSVMALSKYSKNADAAWLFMQWACSKEIMTRCTLVGGFAPTRNSVFDDPRVKAKARVGPGTTRHLDVVRWTINNTMASEPDLPEWAGLANDEIPIEIGKLLTGAAYAGDAKTCLTALAARVEAKLKG